VTRNRRQQFVSWFQDRFFLRFHMTVILGFTFLAGLGVTKLFLEAGNTTLALRYGTAVVASYLAFLMLLKAWLWYVDDRPGRDADAGDVVDLVDVGSDLVSGVGRGVAREFEGGGGSFGGGGASRSFADVGGTGGGSSGGGGVSDVLSGVGVDDEGCVLVLVIVVAVVGIAVSGLYLVYAAPGILAEAAFEALLASSLLRGARRAESPHWVGGVVKSTILPFLGIFVLATGFGWFAGEHCPLARRVVDVLECARLR
jgi:hypothetical protein